MEERPESFIPYCDLLPSGALHQILFTLNLYIFYI
jgi:hypothetical protein